MSGKNKKPAKKASTPDKLQIIIPVRNNPGESETNKPDESNKSETIDNDNAPKIVFPELEKLEPEKSEFEGLSRQEALGKIKTLVDEENYIWFIAYDGTHIYPLTHEMASKYGFYFLYDMWECVENNIVFYTLIFGTRPEKYSRHPASAFYTFAPTNNVMKRVDYLFQAISLVYRGRFNVLWRMFMDLGRHTWIAVLTEKCKTLNEKVFIIRYIVHNLIEYGIHHQNFKFYKLMPAIHNLLVHEPDIEDWQQILSLRFLDYLNNSMSYEMSRKILDPKNHSVPDSDYLWVAQQKYSANKLMEIREDRVWMIVDPRYRGDNPSAAFNKFDNLYDLIQHLISKIRGMGLTCTCTDDKHKCPMNMNILNYFISTKYVRRLQLGNTVISTILYPYTHSPYFRIIKLTKYDFDSNEPEERYRDPIGVETEPDELEMLLGLDTIKKTFTLGERMLAERRERMERENRERQTNQTANENVPSASANSNVQEPPKITKPVKTSAKNQAKTPAKALAKKQAPVKKPAKAPTRGPRAAKKK